MTSARRATIADADELTRLRRIMLSGPVRRGEPVRYVPDGPWIDRCREAFTQRLREDPNFTAFVIDGPQPKTLIAGAVAFLSPRLPSHRNEHDMYGTLHNVATDPVYRRQGHARTVVTAAHQWCIDQGAAYIVLNTTDAARHLYGSLGYVAERTCADMVWNHPMQP